MPIGLARNLTKRREAQQSAAAGADGRSSVTQPLLPTIHSGRDDDDSVAGDVEQAPQPAADPITWRSTVPGTLACVACLFVQKAVQQVRTTSGVGAVSSAKCARVVRSLATH